MQGIDRVVQRVKAMYEPIEAVAFNVFDYGEAASHPGCWPSPTVALL